jgi:hypothetical protein
MRLLLSMTVLFGLALPVAAPAPAVAQEMNACGCYRDDQGNCKCTNKRGKCACPGDCEPVGCEAKRLKDADREAAAALKRIQQKEKKKAAEAAKEAKAAKKKTKAQKPEAWEKTLK